MGIKGLSLDLNKLKHFELEAYLIVLKASNRQFQHWKVPNEIEEARADYKKKELLEDDLELKKLGTLKQEIGVLEKERKQQLQEPVPPEIQQPKKKGIKGLFGLST